MNGTVSVIDLFSPAKVNDPVMVGKNRGVFFKPKAEAKNIVKALLESSPKPKGFLILSQDGIITFESRPN